MSNEPERKKAITIKKITGHRIKTIDIGTEFTIVRIHKQYSFCQGLHIDQIWNDEYELV